MKTCYKCEGKLKEVKVTKEGIRVSCFKCTNCRKEYFTSRELIKFDVLTERR
ncbi:hypothetical protein HZA97_06595 [Candidatus Woesearchaeota archaeon]|nr:hypothetical protein [Candidatus Woesearchaeota archaeon]